MDNQQMKMDDVLGRPRLHCSYLPWEVRSFEMKPWDAAGVAALTWQRLEFVMRVYPKTYHSLPIMTKFSRSAIDAVRKWIKKNPD